MMLTATPDIASAQAKAESFSGEYVVSFLGLPIARSRVESTFENGGFMLESKVASAGLARIFDGAKGAGVSSGRFVDERTQPSAFRADYVEGRKKKSTALGFRGGAVTTIHNVPPLKKRGRDWVPVAPADLAGVVDPLSAGVIKAASPDAVCGRTISIFDGEFRLDAVLKSVPEQAAVTGLGKGTVTCRVQVKAIAGYRKGRKALDYLENRSRIVVAFAPLGSTGVYAPVYATIGTQLGTVTVRARPFEKRD